jgi:hypothetical protein
MTPMLRTTLLALTTLLGLGLIQPLLAQTRSIPADNTVLLTLDGASAANRNGEPNASVRAWRARPDDISLATAAAKQAFIAAMDQGDARWLGNAQAMLSQWWEATDTLPAETLFVRGLVRQGLHDFVGAQGDIARAMQKDPQQPEYWSWHLAIDMVQARLDQAQKTCDQIGLRFGQAEQKSCQAVLLQRAGRPKEAIALLNALARHPDHQGPRAKEWIAFHLGEAHRVAGDQAQALSVWRSHMKQARQQPHGMLVAAVELLNDLGRHEEAWQLNPQRSRSDALLVQAIRSARGLQRPEADDLLEEFEQRLTHQQQRGDLMNERPVIVFQLDVLNRPDQALALAQSAWATQREPADAVLYARAAILQKDRSAAETLLAWQAQTGYREPRLDTLFDELKTLRDSADARPRP